MTDLSAAILSQHGMQCMAAASLQCMAAASLQCIGRLLSFNLAITRLGALWHTCQLPVLKGIAYTIAVHLWAEAMEAVALRDVAGCMMVGMSARQCPSAAGFVSSATNSVTGVIGVPALMPCAGWCADHDRCCCAWYRHPADRQRHQLRLPSKARAVCAQVQGLTRLPLHMGSLLWAFFVAFELPLNGLVPNVWTQ